MRLPPFTNSYNGLTIVLANPSRFDNYELLSGNAGYYLESCLTPLLRKDCDIRTSDTIKEGLLYNTKCILLLGEGALHEWKPEYKDYNVNELRGHKLTPYNNIPCLLSYFPQDCMDLKNYEKAFNEQHYDNSEDSEGSDKEDYGEEKHHKGRTARSNFRFWLRKDCEKIKRILSSGVCQTIPEQFPKYRIYPSSEEAVSILRSKKESYMELDIETDANRNITVFSFSFDDEYIYTIPVIRYTYDLAYSMAATLEIFRALAIAMRDNITVCHNGWGFDLMILAWKYKIPFGRNHYDTMLAHHRCFPEVEKSLGHCMSIWCHEEYHKDEGVFNLVSRNQEQNLWEYNAKDVYGTKLVRKAITEYARNDKGLQDSIAQANDCVYPYLLNTLHGIRYDAALNSSMRLENDRKLNFISNKIIARLTGGEKLLPTSNKSCVNYFHGMLGLKPVARTKTGRPSLDEKAMLKLKLVNKDNALVDTCLKFRQIVKESGSLKFEPWSLEQC